MLKLSSKYAVDFLRREAIDRLVAHFPARRKDFKIHGKFTPDGRYTLFIGDLGTNISLRLDDSIAVISLARSFDIPQVLPLAFYACAQMRTVTIFSGCKDQDGKTWKLSSDDLRRVIVGRDELHREAIRSMEFQIERRISEGCIDERNCRKGLGLSVSESCSLPGFTDVLKNSGWIEELEVCQECRMSFVEDCNDCQDEVWDNLANIFELKDVIWPRVEPGY